MGIINISEAQISSSIYDLESVPYKNENFMTEAYTSIIETEQNWNIFQKTIAESELKYFAQTGEEYILQEADVSGFFSKIKEFFVKVWEKIKKLFAKFMAFIHSFTMDNKSYVKKYRGQISTRFDKLKDFSFKGYKYTIKANSVTLALNAMNRNSFAKDVLSEIPLDVENYTNTSSGEDVKKARESFGDLNDLYDTLRGLASSALGGSTGSITQGDFSKEIKQALRSGDSAKISISKSDISTGQIMNEIENADETKKIAKKDFEESEKALKKMIKAFDDAERKVSNNMKGKSGDEYNKLDNIMNIMNKNASIGRVITQIIQTINGAVMTALKERLHQNKSICTKILTGAVEKEYKDESFIEHYSEGIGMFSAAEFI